MTATMHPEPTEFLPNYTARRFLVAVVALAVLAAGVIAVVETVGALVDLGGRPAAASEITSAVTGPSTHVAAPGDTLWAIAEQYRGDVGRDRYVDALIDLNGGTTIQVGQSIRLP